MTAKNDHASLDFGRPAGRGSRHALASGAALLSAVLGAIVLAGWAVGVPALRSIIPGAVEMKANTALALVAGGAALFIAARGAVDGLGRSVGMTLSLLVALLGAVTLLQYLTGWNAGIDQLLVRDTSAAFNQAKGRMSPFSAVALLVFGCATALLLHGRAAGFVRGCGAVVTGIGVISLVGYLWNAAEIVSDQIVPPVAVNTALAFIALGSALLMLASPAEPVGQRARTRLETLVLRGFMPTVLFVLIGGGLTYQAGANFSRAAERIAHTQEVRAQIGRVDGAVVDAESAQRNHVLTGEAAFEAEFLQRAEDARRYVAELGKLVSDNTAQVQRQMQLVRLIDMRLLALRQTSQIRREQGEVAARAAQLAETRSTLATQIRTIGRQMDDAESELLNLRLEHAQQQRQVTLVSLMVTLSVLVGLFMLLFRSIRAEVAARLVAEEGLKLANAGLEQRVAERTRELSFQQSFLRRVIDVNGNLIFAKDRGGHFVLANQALADALGTTVDALVGKREQAFSEHDEQLDRFREADLRVIESGQELVIDEELMIDAAGKERWLATVKRPILAPDNLETIVLGVAVDITARKAAEEGVRQLAADLERRVEERTHDLHQTNRELEQARLESEAASRAKSAFLANMSHEIRTPMNAIIGLTHLMSRDQSDPVQLERLSKVGDAAQHLLQVLNDILDLSKIEAGKLTLEDAEFSLDTVLSRAIDMVAPRARDKGLELIIDADHLPSRLRGDPTRFSQILINLLTNAVKFTEHGWVRVRGEILAEDGPRLRVRFEVQDTGPGIAAERQDELFNAFEQADNSITRRYGGTGLGLALTRQLAIAMGGEAGVVSAPGAGSTFWFDAWLARGEEARARETPIDNRGLRALLVDDLPEARSAIGDCLQMLGLKVDALSSGAAALVKVEAEMAVGRPYDVLLIDWRMEPLDGIETLRHLRRLLGHGMPPSILITASDDPTVLAQARAVHYSTVLIKPVRASTLNDALAEVLRRPMPPSTVRTGQPASEPETLVRLRHAGQRVLLAEDNPVNQEVAEELLHSVGLVVETAWDGARAVEMALTRPYDLVLMDMQMPVMDGLEAARAIREHAGRALPIIAMTANAFIEDREACLAAGMNDHVAKPVDPVLMYSTMLRWLPLRPQAASPAPVEAVPVPGAPKPADFVERLRAVGGLDVDAALRVVAGQAPALARVLRRFVNTYGQGLPELLDTSGTDAELAQRWRRSCHSIRGALSAIGATALIEELRALERDLAEGFSRSEVLDRGRGLHEGLTTLVARLAAELPPA